MTEACQLTRDCTGGRPSTRSARVVSECQYEGQTSSEETTAWNKGRSGLYPCKRNELSRFEDSTLGLKIEVPGKRGSSYWVRVTRKAVRSGTRLAIVGVMRNVLLGASRNRWLRERAARYPFVRRTVSRVMPGKELCDALAAAARLRDKGIATVLTHLRENISDPAEADRVTCHYLQVLDRIRELGLPSEVSIKLTQLGLDLSPELCYRNVERIVRHTEGRGIVWIDMEASPYVDATLALFRRARQAREGYRMRVMVNSGSAWLAWCMRRLAKRPANLWFVARNVFAC